MLSNKYEGGFAMDEPPECPVTGALCREAQCQGPSGPQWLARLAARVGLEELACNGLAPDQPTPNDTLQTPVS